MSNDMIALGTLGNREGVNVARVEVSWEVEQDDDGGPFTTRIEHGYFVVHATGDEPECQGEYGTIYNVFEDLVHTAMQAKQDAGLLDSYEIEDTSSC